MFSHWPASKGTFWPALPSSSSTLEILTNILLGTMVFPGVVSSDFNSQNHLPVIKTKKKNNNISSYHFAIVSLRRKGMVQRLLERLPRSSWQWQQTFTLWVIFKTSFHPTHCFYFAINSCVITLQLIKMHAVFFNDSVKTNCFLFSFRMEGREHSI